MRASRDEALEQAIIRLIAADPTILGLQVREGDCGNHVAITGDLSLVVTVSEYERMTRPLPPAMGRDPQDSAT